MENSRHQQEGKPGSAGEGTTNVEFMASSTFFSVNLCAFFVTV